MILSKGDFEKIIEKDIEYLMSQKNTLERSHIIDILKGATDLYYSPQFQKIVLPEEDELLAESERHEEKYSNDITKTAADDFIDGANFYKSRLKELNSWK